MNRYVYRKWNENLFEERYNAFKAGRAEDPSLTWYEDELEFFDKYVIPLATQMKECKIFDSSCGEPLRYAMSNREQWELSGREEVASMLERFKEIVFEVDEKCEPVPEEKLHFPQHQNTTRKLPPRGLSRSDDPASQRLEET